MLYNRQPKVPLKVRLENAHRRRMEARSLRLNGPLYKSLEEATKVDTAPVVHKVASFEDKLFARIPVSD